MFCAEQYMVQLQNALTDSFGKRLAYVGLQGSYMRGEATENSDIDPMVVIDGLSVLDLNAYRKIIENMEAPEKSCGFICSTEDLHLWNPLEICHLLHTTKDIYGELHALVPVYSDDDVENFVKLSVNNLYHEITHRYVHASELHNQNMISNSFKSVFFVLQNLHYLESSNFIATKRELLTQLSGIDAEVLEVAMDLNRGVDYDFPWLFELLHSWCRNVSARV